MSLTSSPRSVRRPARSRAVVDVNRRRLVATVAAVIAVGAMSACSADDGSSADAGYLSDFRDRAAAGADASYSATYALAQSDAAGDATVAVAHTPTDLRLDITTKAGVSTSITTPASSVVCQSAAKTAPTCLTVAGPGEQPPASLDPGLRGVFTTTLDKLGQGFGTVEIVGTPADLDNDTLCGRVTGNDVTNGLYCLTPTGVIESANFTSGSLKLSEQGAAPTPASFEPPAPPQALKS